MLVYCSFDPWEHINQYTTVCNRENELQNIVCGIAAILFRPQEWYHICIHGHMLFVKPWYTDTGSLLICYTWYCVSAEYSVHKKYISLHAKSIQIIEIIKIIKCWIYAKRKCKMCRTFGRASNCASHKIVGFKVNFRLYSWLAHA